MVDVKSDLMLISFGTNKEVHLLKSLKEETYNLKPTTYNVQNVNLFNITCICFVNVYKFIEIFIRLWITMRSNIVSKESHKIFVTGENDNSYCVSRLISS